MSDKQSKYTCKGCSCRMFYNELLTAKSPFDATMIFACWKCKDIDNFDLACDQDQCWENVSCGTPSSKGYRNTCGKHAPKENV